VRLLTNNLDLDIDLDELLGQWVDLHETGIHSSCESPELGDQTHVSLTDWLVRIGTDDTARNGAECSNARPK
jgi:hypothetical protein